MSSNHAPDDYELCMKDAGRSITSVGIYLRPLRATLEFMKESLGHKDMATRQAYFAGFDDDTKKEFVEGLMGFN